MKKYDLTLKDIFKDSEQGLIQFAVDKNAKFIRYLDVNFQNIESKESDLILETRINDSDAIVHLEFQSDNDCNMVYRMLRYLCEIQRQYNKPVYQVLIYAGKSKMNMENKLYFKMAEQSYIDYRYRIINFEEVEAEDILNLNITEILPLLSLTKQQKDKEKNLEKVINTVIARTGNTDINTRRNLLLKTEILSGLKYNKELIIRLFAEVKDMFSLKQSAGYQAILEEGIEEGKQIGITEGKQIGITEGKQIGITEGKQIGITEGKQIGLEMAIIGILENKFGCLSLKIANKIKKINSIDSLNIALQNSLKANTIDEFLKTFD